MSRKNMMLVLSGSALGLTSVATAGTPDLDRAYAAELRADSAAYTSLLQAGGSGHDGHFFLGDGSGNNRLNIGGLIQFRYIFNNRDSDDLGAEDDSGVGFETHRTQLNLGGNIISPNWKYGIKLEFGTDDQGFDTVAANSNSSTFTDDASIIRDAWVQYDFEGDSSGTYLKWGQFVSPAVREDASSDATGLAVERSAVNEFFSGGYVQGVTLGHQAEEFAISGTFHDGMGFQGIGVGGTGGTEFGDEAHSDYAFALRFDYKVEGDWAQFDDSTSWRGSNNGFRIGGGLNYQTGGNTITAFGASTEDVDYTLWTIDAAYEGNGWNVSAAYVGSTWDSEDSGLDVDNNGFLVQGGYFVSEDVELFARYDFLDIDENLGGDEDTQSWVTVGGNYYLTPGSHAAKFTADVVFAFDDAYTLGSPGGLGLGDTGLAGGSDDEFLVRAQLQLVF